MKNSTGLPLHRWDTLFGAARIRAVELADEGDADGAGVWRRILEAIKSGPAVGSQAGP
jgi:hypothetical protein